MFKDNLLRGRERSIPMPESGREGGAGDEGRLLGLKKAGFLRACIMSGNGWIEYFLDFRYVIGDNDKL